jgi:hypothetical protein
LGLISFGSAIFSSSFGGESLAFFSFFVPFFVAFFSFFFSIGFCSAGLTSFFCSSVSYEDVKRSQSPENTHFFDRLTMEEPLIFFFSSTSSLFFLFDATFIPSLGIEDSIFFVLVKDYFRHNWWSCTEGFSPFIGSNSQEKISKITILSLEIDERDVNERIG